MDAFISKHLKGVSRTYAILIPMLPRSLGEAVGLAYLLMRIVDTLEDATELSPRQRRRLLRELDAILRADECPASPALARSIGDNESERDLMRCAPEVFERIAALEPVYRDAARHCARRMIGGVREFMARSARRGIAYPAIRDAAELRSYCYYVAGVVGEMLCTMMAHYLRQPALTHLRDMAVELGVGLQLVNILKDALKDSRQGRRYLPLASGGSISHMEIYRAVLSEARESLRRGAEFVYALPASARELRSFCGLPIAWGAMTLARAERNAGQAKIGRGAVRSSIERFKVLVGDDRALRSWFAQILRSPQGDVAAARS